jgi:hypothetical protein
VPGEGRDVQGREALAGSQSRVGAESDKHLKRNMDRC